MWIWRADRNEPVWVGPADPPRGIGTAPGLGGGGGPGSPGKKGAQGGGGALEYGISSFGGSLATVNNDEQYGMEFTVGGNDIEVSALRMYAPNADSKIMDARLWRVSDQAELALVQITRTAADEWLEENLSSPVILTAGANYIVTIYNSTNTSHYRDANAQSGTYNPAISFVEGRVGNAGTAFPTLTSSANNYGIADIGFTVA